MDIGNVPLSALVGSFLKAMRDKEAEATVVYFSKEGSPKGEAQIATNKGDQAVKRALAMLHKAEAGHLEHGAKALHELCRLGVVKAPLRCSQPSSKWETLGPEGRAEHVAAAQAVVQAIVASLGPEAEPAPSVIV